MRRTGVRGGRGRPAPSTVVDVAVLLAGLAVLAGAAAWWRADGADPRLWQLLPACVPVGYVLTRFPLTVSSGSVGLSVPCGPLLLAYLLTADPPGTALLAWAVTALVAYLLDARRWTSRVFNAGSSIVSALAATLVVQALRAPDPTSPRQLLVALAGAATYYLVDLLLSVATLAAESPAVALRELRGPGTVVGGGVFLLVSTLGYLGGVVDLRLPDWMTLLLLVPAVAVVVAAWSSREVEHRRTQQHELFRASVEVLGAGDPEQLLAALQRHGSAVVSSGRLRVADAPPGPGELGFALPVEEGAATPEGAATRPRWLVTTRSPEASLLRYDQAALESLGSLGAAALLRVRLTEQAARHALLDHLTGLANRRAFTARLEAALAGGEPLGVLFVDLDGFKAVNDTLGHAAGDELLGQVGERLRRVAGEGSLPARLGGDEFAVLVPDTVPGSVEDVCDRVVAALEDPFVLVAGPASVAASVGATTSGPGDDADAMLSRADAAMYEAKRSGGSRSVVAHRVG
ncbi:diguanylate cyclase domain-containing protein [Kineococcus indalonis]|uniref:diguanylate cyclase domain-containing protein n=1 Tax=Kineococcus indalonis TaxID=2696566 RepID=UPI0014136442|nr:GGDEF domain-containing protein [Kineococcus indalonis]NAZ84673.1 diguanylate cyclase [Kineococcus indalonis]